MKGMKGLKLSIALLLCFGWISAQEKPKPATKDGLSPQREEFCPTLNVSYPDAVEPGQLLTFSASVGGDVKPTFNWAVSKGVIIEGQGTPLIKVDTTGLRDECVVATVAVGGLGPRCDRALFGKTLVRLAIFDPMVFDRYGRLRWKEERTRLDNIAKTQRRIPDSEILIFAFDESKAKKGAARALANRARQYLITRDGIEPERVRIRADSDFVGVDVIKEMRLDFYILPYNLSDPCRDK